MPKPRFQDPSPPVPAAVNLRVWSVTLFVFLVGLLLSGATMLLFQANRVQARRQEVVELTLKAAHDIQENLNRSLSSTYAIAAVIRQGNGRIDNFQELAREMLELYPGVNCLQLVPHGIITQVAPLKGNEKALGVNLLDPYYANRGAREALRTGTLTLAGPFELIQGGVGLVGRLPVYLQHERGKEFWGFTAAMIRLDGFFEAAHLKTLLPPRFNYRISRIEPDTGKLAVFWSRGGKLSEPVSQRIEVPNGEWTISVEPADGWYERRVILAEAFAVLIFSGFWALAAWWLTRQPAVLQRMVDERTRALSESNARLQIEVAERKHAEEALLASEEKLRSIFASLTDVILVLDAEGRYLEIAPTSTKRLYLPPDELVGKRIHEVFEREQADFFVDNIRKALASGRTVSIDYPLVIGGEEVWFTANIAPLSQDRVILSAHDMTARKRSEEERLKLEKQMLHTQKLESLGVLAGGIAHDFNNILTTIIGNADLALMRLNPESPAVGNLRRIETAAARAADLARQMLAYSGKGHFVTEELDLNRLVEEMGQMLEVSISKKVALRYHLNRPIPAVTADATQIRQVVMNLVINASEAIGDLGDDGGTISVSTGCVECTEASLAGGWVSDRIPEGEYVFLEVADTGCGMDRDTMAKIFDPFFTTKFTGRGLGMAAVLGIVRGHRGTIRVYSEPGLGSTFKVLLPAGERPADAPRSREAAELQGWRGRGTVLLVDDDENIRRLGTEMLTELGFQVVTAADGREGVEIFRSRDDILVVLLDLTMPQLDGEQCFLELRRIDPGVRVVMSSGFSEHEVTRKFLGKGIAGFVQKPYKLAALRKALMDAGCR